MIHERLRTVTDVAKYDPELRHKEAGCFHNPDSDLIGYRMDVERCAFILGIFAGARVTGAPREKIEALKDAAV